jgi:hypothetical protein
MTTSTSSSSSRSPPFEITDHFHYDCDQPDERLACPICRVVLTGPVMCMNCGHMFCAGCVAAMDKDSCAMCRQQRPEYCEPPVYVKDDLRERPNIKCLTCDDVVSCKTARTHWFTQCKRVVHDRSHQTGHFLPANSCVGERCIGKLGHSLITSHGRVYTGNNSGALPDRLNGKPLAAGLQWIAQQALDRSSMTPSVSIDTLMSVLVDAEHYRPTDFGLAHEAALQERIEELEASVSTLKDQRSTLRSEIAEAETRVGSLLLDLIDARDQVEQLQEQHCGQSTSRKRSRRVVFDGQPSVPTD